MPDTDEGLPFNSDPPEETTEVPFKDPDPVQPPAVAADRASRATFGLNGKVDKTYPDYYQAFSTAGEERLMRGYIVNRLAEANDARRAQMLVQAARDKGSALEPEDIDAIDNAINDPRSVVEDHFSHEYMNYLNWPKNTEDTHWWKGVSAEMPKVVQNAVEIGSEYRAKIEYGKTKLQDAQDTAKDQSWFGWGLDQAKELSGIYQILKAHPSGGSWSLLAGNMRQDFVNKLWSLPYDQMKNEYEAYIATLNPSDAKQFASDFMGHTSNVQFLENVFPFISVEGTALGSAGLKIAKYNWINNAVRQHVLGEVQSQFPELSASLNAGNLQEATQRRAWGDLIRRQRRADPVADAVEDLPYLFKQARQRLVEEYNANASVGADTFGAKDIIDSYDELIRTFPQMMDKLTRPERVAGLAERYAPAIQAAQEDVINRNKYIRPYVQNLSEPYRQPYTRSWFVDAILGESTQKSFGTKGQAGKWAAKMGVDGFDMVGDDVKHVEGLTGMERTVAEMAASERFNTEEEARTAAEARGIKNYTIEGAPRELGESMAHLENPDDFAYSVRNKFTEGLPNVPVTAKERDVQVHAPGEGKKVFLGGKAIWRINENDNPVKVLPGKLVKTSGKWWVPIEVEGKTGRYAPFDQLHGSSFEPHTPTSPPTSGFRLNIQGLDSRARLEQSGNGWVVVKPIAVDETSPAMRQYYAALSTDRTPKGGILNAYMSKLRTPNETLSDWMNRNREAATFSSSVIEQYAWDQLEAVRKMAPAIKIGKMSTSQKWNDFERILNSMQKVRDPTTGSIGYTFQTVGELQYQYMKILQRLPDEQETAAYFAFKRTNEMDHALRAVSILRNKYREGVMSHRFWYMSGADKIMSPEIDGISQAEFPAGHSGDTIAIINDNGKPTIRRVGSFNQIQKAKFKWQVSTGEYKVVELFNPSQSPLANWAGITDDQQIRYIMIKSGNASDKPLSWTSQLPWRGGGHFIPKYNQYIKQIAMKKEVIDGVPHWYATGVNTLMPVPNGVEGRRIIGHLEQIRTLLQRYTPENIAAAKDIVENTLHMNWPEVRGWFRPTATRDPATGQMVAGQRPMYNLTEPFQLVDVNKNLINMDREGLEQRYPKGQFTDATRHGDKSLQYQVPFSQERDYDELMNLENKGTVANPTYAWEASPMIDAVPALTRALTKVSNTFLMDEMKQHAVESWLQEASAALKAGGATESELQASPLYWFNRGDLKPSVGIDAARVSELETARFQIKQFVGQVSETDAVTHVWAQKLADSIYENTPIKRFNIDPTTIAHTLQDPTRFFRAITFHLKMGLFSIPQIMVQGQTYVNILGIAGPVKAAQGTVGALMWQWSRINANENILRAMDRHATKMGWGTGQWMNARKDALDTGFMNVGREYALIDNPMSNKYVQTAWGKFLDLGALPFTEGERNVRAGSWFTAWKEYADETGKSVMNNEDKLKILNRASLLNGNMNRASNALYQRGWSSLPAQFLTYTIRQAELMWGKRLNPMEKARLLLTNALMYGLPVGLGITGLPSDWLRQNAIKNGYTPGENYFNTTMTEGIPSTIIGLVTGGQYLNIGERYGNTGLTAFYSDKTIWEMALGATGSTLKGIFEAADPFYRKILYTLSGDPAGFNVMPEHFAQIAREAGSVNNTWRSIVALKTGQLLTKQGQVLSNKMDTFSSIVMGLTGLQPQESTDFYLMTSIASKEKEVQQWAEKRFDQEYHRALEAFDNKDTSNGNAFMANAFAYMEMFTPEEDRARVLADASKNWETIIERVQQSFGTKHVPPALRQTRRDQYLQGLGAPH